MTLRSGIVMAALTGGLLSVAFMAGIYTAPPFERPLSCRPSAPQRAIATLDLPAVMLLGNSQLYDHAWNFTGALTVNCARQGLLLQTGLEQV